MSIVDNFFQDPDKVRDIALSVKYESTTDYPGYRSRQIHEINKDLWDYMSYRLMELPEAKLCDLDISSFSSSVTFCFFQYYLMTSLKSFISFYFVSSRHFNYIVL